MRNGPPNWLHEARHVIGTIGNTRLVQRDEQTASDLDQPYMRPSAPSGSGSSVPAWARSRRRGDRTQARPGWAEADATVLRAAASLAEKAFDQAGQPDVSASEWEQLVAMVLRFAGS